MASTLVAAFANAAATSPSFLATAPGLSDGLGQSRDDIGRGQRGVGPVVELGCAGFEAFPRRPVVIGDDRHGVVELCDLMHAGHLQRRRLIERGERAAEHRRGGDGRDLHARQLDVDAEHRRAVDLAGDIEPLGRRADDAERAGVLELDVGRDWQLRRSIG